MEQHTKCLKVMSYEELPKKIYISETVMNFSPPVFLCTFWLPGHKSQSSTRYFPVTPEASPVFSSHLGLITITSLPSALTRPPSPDVIIPSHKTYHREHKNNFPGACYSPLTCLLPGVLEGNINTSKSAWRYYYFRFLRRGRGKEKLVPSIP